MKKVGGIYFWNIGPIGGSFYLKKNTNIVPALWVGFVGSSASLAGLLIFAITL